VVVPESSEELSEPLEVDPISSRHEPYESYYPDGQLMEKGFKLDGVLDGPYESYDSHGQLWTKGTYGDGEKYGEWLDVSGKMVTYPLGSTPDSRPSPHQSGSGLVPCVDCSKEISRATAICPHCGGANITVGEGIKSGLTAGCVGAPFMVALVLWIMWLSTC